jgi:DNA-binding transcriptional LysR family regulator
MRYTLRQLEVFLATARHENISRAAEQLAMSQSAASGSLKELEKQFGVQLFDRIGKTLQLSELGQQLRPEAERLLDQAAELEQSLGGESVHGKLKIGATLTIGNYIAVDLIADYRSRYPDTDVALRVANTETIAEQVASYNLDMGLIEGELQRPDLNISHWRSDELTVFAHPQHPLVANKNNKPLTDKELTAEEWIVREPGSGTRQAFNRAFQGILPDLKIGMELQHTEAIKRAVESGLGIGCLSRICLEDAFKRGSLVPLPVPHRDFRREWYLISHRKKYHGAALAAWYDLCQNDWAH